MIDELVEKYNEKDPELNIKVEDGCPIILGGTVEKLIGLLFDLGFLGKYNI